MDAQFVIFRLFLLVFIVFYQKIVYNRHKTTGRLKKYGKQSNGITC